MKNEQFHTACFVFFCGLFLLVLLGNAVRAEQAYVAEVFETQAQEAQFEHITKQLRCLVCQNQTLADSSAGLAEDLRAEVAARIRVGESDNEIFTFMVERYGDFILYNPPLKMTTALLWLGPFALLGIVFLIWYGVAQGSFRKNKSLFKGERQPK